MDFDSIRKMNDEELSKYLRTISNKRGDSVCLKCDKKAVFFIKIENSNTFQTKKLCGLCEDCYKKMLKDLGAYDIIWND